jgi:hypothetical protein
MSRASTVGRACLLIYSALLGYEGKSLTLFALCILRSASQCVKVHENDPKYLLARQVVIRCWQKHKYSVFGNAICFHE